MQTSGAAVPALTPNQRSIAECYVAQWAPRADAYADWDGEHWTAVRRPLTPEVVAASMRTKVPVSCYFPDPEGLTHVAALDFDVGDGLALAYRVAAAMRARGAEAYVEPSRRGAHLWWPLAAQAPAWRVRRAMRGALAAAGVAPDPKIEFRPESSDAPGPGGLGKSLRMPMMPHPATGKGFPLHRADGEPLPYSMADSLLAMADPSPRAVVEALAALGPPDLRESDQADRPPRTWSAIDRAQAPTVTEVAYERWGVALRAGRANKCFAHDDRNPSLSVTADDERLICKSPECRLHNNGKGYGSIQLRALEL